MTDLQSVEQDGIVAGNIFAMLDDANCGVNRMKFISDTGSTLIQAANDEEGGGGLLGHRQYCYRQHCAKHKMPVFK